MDAKDRSDLDASSPAATTATSIADAPPPSTVPEHEDPPTPDLTAESVELGADAARFEIRRRLGAGGFGTVYEAFDRKRDARVALKTMNRRDGRSLYRFKQEFRALAELSHPNLVQLYELRGDGERWFFTMELLHGRDAYTYAREGRGFDEARVRSVFRQLAEALCFLHDAGRLHRDIKPSNVMVTSEGRAVLLDFGLVVDLGAEGDQTAGNVAGTPRYMAPEQMGDEPVGPAADWYAVGVMLYQVLAGRVPFEGSAIDLMGKKLTRDPRPPSAWVGDVPGDLDQLCQDLLRREPSQRPPGREVLARLCLHEAREAEAQGPAEDGRRRGGVFVGRAAELGALRAAFDVARAGRAGAALVHGRSGMGKSALVARFLDGLRAVEPDVVALAGRCFEQESVPYKALDGLVDALVRLLQRMPDAEVAAVVPRDGAMLTRLFPVLGRVPALASARRRGEGGDQVAQRRRAFAALRELFARLGDARPLVLAIDDLQWGDADSGALLWELLRPPDPPAMLVVLAYRTDDAERSECLRALLPALREGSVPIQEVAVERLGDEDARALVRAELAGGGPAPPVTAGGTPAPPVTAGGTPAPPPPEDEVATIARESGGWPFFLREICRFSAGPSGAPPSLEAMLAARVAALSGEARRLIEVISVASRPIAREIAVRAAKLGDAGPAALGRLRTDHLARVRGDGSGDEIEPYHDRIRETVLARLAPEAAKGHHLALATALLEGGGADEETLAVHFRAAGKPGEATEHTVKAADQALDALGVDRAARLYREAIAAIAEDDPRRLPLHEKLGLALGSAQRGPEAAAAYLVAAGCPDAARALDLRRRAAEHYLASGHIDAGLAVLRAVLDATGLSMPRSPLAAVVRMLPLLLLVWLRGLRFRERSEQQVGSADLLRIDACAAVSRGLLFGAPMVAGYFQQRFLRLALRAGEPHRVRRALIYESMFQALTGRAVPSSFEERLHRETVSLTARLGDPGAHLRTGQGVVLMLRGRWHEARAELERAELEIQESGASVGGDAALGRLYLIVTLYFLGAWRDLRVRQAEFIADARARSDLVVEVVLSFLTGHLPGLMADDPDAARDVIEGAAARWPDPDEFQRLRRGIALAATEQYREEGAGAGALEALERSWRGTTFSRTIALDAYFHVVCLFHRGSARLTAAAVAAPSRRATLLAAASRDAQALSRVGIPLGRVSAACLRASAAATRGDLERAVVLLAEAEAACAAISLAMTAAAARRRRGALVGGDEGRALVASADAEMAAQEIVNPGRMASLFFPGRW